MKKVRISLDMMRELLTEGYTISDFKEKLMVDRGLTGDEELCRAMISKDTPTLYLYYDDGRPIEDGIEEVDVMLSTQFLESL